MKNFILTVDVVLLTLLHGTLHVALHPREAEPFKGQWALPGGYVHTAKDACASASAARVLRGKMNLQSPYLEELGTFSGPSRDPRGWSLTVAYYALVAPALLPTDARLWPVEQLPALAFDHACIIASALARVRSKASYSSLPVHLCPAEFTIPELHAVYEAVLGEVLNKANFRRKLDDLGVLEAIPGAMRAAGRSRPGQLYRVAQRFAHMLSVRGRGL